MAVSVSLVSLKYTDPPDESGRGVKTYTAIADNGDSRERPAKWVGLGETGAARHIRNCPAVRRRAQAKHIVY